MNDTVPNQGIGSDNKWAQLDFFASWTFFTFASHGAIYYISPADHNIEGPASPNYVSFQTTF